MSAKSKAAPGGIPTVDVDSLVAGQRRNVEAVIEAGRIVVDGAQAVARRQAEILQGRVEAAVAEAKDLWQADGKIDFDTGKPVAKAKEAYLAAVAEAQELAGLGVKAGREAYEVLERRALASLGELGRAAA